MRTKLREYLLTRELISGRGISKDGSLTVKLLALDVERFLVLECEFVLQQSEGYPLLQILPHQPDFFRPIRDCIHK